MDNTNHEETHRTYWAKDIADLLEITTSNLRRWSIDLENEGYRFYRDEHNRRAYFEKDIMPLRKLKEFLANNMSKNDAIKAVISIYQTWLPKIMFKYISPPLFTTITTNPLFKEMMEELHSLIEAATKEA